MNYVLIFLLVADLLFVGTGGVLLGLAFKVKNDMTRAPTAENVAGNLLLMHTPLDGRHHLPSHSQRAPLT